jgi:hypothetical protein
MEVEVKGRTVLIDDEDLELFLNHSWRFNTANHGYIRNNKLGLFHKYIMKCPYGYEIDHINRNTFDHRKSNLRIVSSSINGQNCKRKSIYDYTGVHRRSNGKYYSRITYNYKQIYLGTFKTLEAAAVHYDMAAIHLFGCFAHINFPERREEYANILKEHIAILSDEDYKEEI